MPSDSGSGAAGTGSGGGAAGTGSGASFGPGVWVELSIACDIEAVETVSEILTRYAPGGTSVEPGFTLSDEGLGAVIDTAKPATVRAYLPGRDPASVEAAVADAAEA